MGKKTYLSIFVSGAIIAGLMTTGCQSKPDNSKLEIQQVDTPAQQIAPADGVQQPQDTLVPAAKDTTSTKSMNEATKKKPLTVVIDNLASPTATVEISVYNADSKFPTENGQLKKYRFKPVGGKLTAHITDLAYGQYAVATFQDLDEDGKIGKNMIGIPTDPYGFSNNYRPKIKAPSFKDCQFEYDASSPTVSISMIKKGK